MSEQILMPYVGKKEGNNQEKAVLSLEKARLSHEKYLLNQQNNDLQDAIDNYIDAVKYDPTIPETYYRLATLMWEQGQISINGAIEQCQTAISLSQNNTNAHIYTGYFLQLSQNYQAAEKEFKAAIGINQFRSGRPRMILSQAILQRINSKNAKNQKG